MASRKQQSQIGKWKTKATTEKVKEVASAKLPTRFGEFRVLAFSGRRGEEPLAIVRGEVFGKENVLVRVHSQCLTGDVFGSLRCDCREQLEEALRMIAARGSGVLIYLKQEGRGIGLANKIKAYHLQENGYDTADANEALGFAQDMRHYSIAGAILKRLGVRSIELLTNNPQKVTELALCGIKISKRAPLITKPNPHNRLYLKTKAEKLGHLLGGG